MKVIPILWYVHIVYDQLTFHVLITLHINSVVRSSTMTSNPTKSLNKWYDISSTRKCEVITADMRCGSTTLSLYICSTSHGKTKGVDEEESKLDNVCVNNWRSNCLWYYTVSCWFSSYCYLCLNTLQTCYHKSQRHCH